MNSLTTLDYYNQNAQSFATGTVSVDFHETQDRFLKLLDKGILNRSGHVYYHPWLVMLNEQRRMHPQIAGFSNQYVYGGLLLNHPDTRTNRNEIVNAELFSKQAINLIDLSGCYCAASKNADNSRFNILSAMISFAIAVKTEKNVETVSIITPYAAQTRLVRAMELDYREHNDTQIRCATV